MKTTRREMKKKKKKRKMRLMLATTTTMKMMMQLMTFKRRKMKKRLSNSCKKSPAPDPNPNPHLPDWAGLPDHLLVLILGLLSHSIADLLSSASVCRSWRSAAASASSSAPPLFLFPLLSTQRRPVRLTWLSPPRCTLQTLAPALALRSYHSPCSPHTLRRSSCIGYSHSHLILTSPPPGCGLILADVFTGLEVLCPPIPTSRGIAFSSGISTAPPSSPCCSVLVAASYCASPDGSSSSRECYSVFCWKPGSDGWSELTPRMLTAQVVSFISFQGRVYCLDSLSRLFVVEFAPGLSWKLLQLQSCLSANYVVGQWLAECGGELLMLLFLSVTEASTARFPGFPFEVAVQVYRMDFARSLWIKKESLGDWCLFVDSVGSCAAACPKPARWGGQSNCVYFAGQGSDWCSEYPLGGEVVDAHVHAALSTFLFSRSKWPAPVWVYPTFQALPAPAVISAPPTAQSEPLEIAHSSLDASPCRFFCEQTGAP